MSTTTETGKLQERGSLLVSLLRQGRAQHARRVLLWGGLVMVRTLALAFVGLAVFTALVPILPRPLGMALAVLLWAGASWLVWRHWVRPLRAVPNLAVFSRLIEERRDFRDMLRAALEFSQRGVPESSSSDLVTATVDRAYDEARSLDLVQLFSFPRRHRDGTLLAAATGVIVLLALLAPALPRRAAQALRFGYPSPASIVYGSLEVQGGNFDVLAGEDVVVRVVDHGPLAPEMVLRFNDTGDLWKSRPLVAQGARSPHTYEFRFDNVRDHTAYRFESAKRRTDEFQIRIVQRPILNRFSLRLVPPAYVRREPHTLEEGRGDAVALIGTRVEIEGTASTPLARGRLLPENDAGTEVTLPGPLRLDLDGAAFRTAFTLRSDLRYHFDIEDSLGNRNTDPVTYQISAIEDRPPYVELRTPEPDATLPKSAQVELLIQAADDFGISSMTLIFKREREGEDLQQAETRTRLVLHDGTALDPDGKPVGKEPAPELLKTHPWDLSTLGLFPGDFISYWIEVEDNDAVSGHKTGRTPVYRLRLPTLGELYAELQDKDENRMSELDKVLEEGKELQEKYERMARELKKNPEMDWKKEQEIQKSLEKQKEIAEKVDEIAKDMQQELDKMEEQQVVSAEIAEKMEEIRRLMQEVDDETLRDYMQRLQEAMKQISPEEIQRSLEKMELSQEEFLQRLERTKALLEQLQREQQLDQLVERTAELLQQQENLSQRTDALDQEMQNPQTPKDGAQNQDSQQQQKQESERLGEEQSKLSETSEALERELEELLKKMQEAGRSELNEAGEMMQSQPPSEEMREASKNLQQQQPQEAQPSQEGAEKRLRALYEQMMQAQMAMGANMDQETLVALQKAARQSLDVSFRQELLSRKALEKGDEPQSGDLARSQQSLRAATRTVTEGLEAAGKNSPAVPQNVTALLVQAMGKMTQGVDAFEKGNALAGRLHGEDAYADLNRAVIELNRSTKSCQSGGGGGSPSSGQRMGEMVGQQQRLNDATRQLQSRLKNPGQMSPEERAAMARLLAEQRSIEGELRDIERQAREERDMLGRMDKMLGDMQEVVEDMESEGIDQETLDLQDHIVSRMLDASRSLHKRDYNKERESRDAGEVFSEGGAPLAQSDQHKKLRQDILRALESGTPEEYQELVRQYFRAIAEAEESKLP
ncbi:MAG TPA: DUF4175 family protein [Candidatus Krumholzibacteria bacterium]|nr:DUF4175 family protein [Candidatus Krumholzibacteria bacterium]